MSAAKIPVEYMAADFGFSAVDAPPTSQESAPPSIGEDDVEKIVQRLDTIIEKADRAAADLDSLMQQVQNKHTVAVSDIEEANWRIGQVEKLIMPLLVNLKKTEDKPYIHWPNRGPQVQKTINELLALTRGSEYARD